MEIVRPSPGCVRAPQRGGASSRLLPDVRTWDDPGRAGLERALRECRGSDDDPDLRGLAYEGEVWVWAAHEATHQEMAQTLGLVDGLWRSDRRYQEFCFFLVYGARFLDDATAPILVSYTGGTPQRAILLGTAATRWQAEIVAGGPWVD